MKHSDQLINYLSETNFAVDDLGRIVIDDPAILAEINGAYGGGDAFTSAMHNGACANASC